MRDRFDDPSHHERTLYHGGKKKEKRKLYIMKLEYVYGVLFCFLLLFLIFGGVFVLFVILGVLFWLGGWLCGFFFCFLVDFWVWVFFFSLFCFFLFLFFFGGGEF